MRSLGQPRSERRRLGIAVFFILCGGIFVAGFFLMISGPPLYGGSRFEKRPLFDRLFQVMPFAVYFGGGVIAALVKFKWLRELIALFCHGIPIFVGLCFTPRENWPGMLLAAIFFMGTFSLAWIALLKGQRKTSA